MKSMDDYGYYYANVSIDEPRINVLRRAVNSALLLFFALVLTTLCYESIEALACLALKYWVKFRFSEVRTVTEPGRWSLPRVIVVYSAGPLICILLIMIGNSIYHTWEKMVNQYKLLFLWIVVASLNLITANMIEAPIGLESTTFPFYRSFAILGAWFRLGSAPLLVVMFAGFILNVLGGYFFSYRFLEYSHSSKLIHHRSGKVYVFFQVFILPIIVVAPLYLSLAGNFNILHFATVLISLMTFSLGFFVRSITDMGIVVCNKNDVLNKVPVVTGIAAVVIWVAIFIFLK
ncbi:MAG: hypothetical protein U0V74_15850 [Chitinophagales bacterium]